MPAKPLTAEQLEEASKLRALFESWQDDQRKAGLKASQEAAAEQLGFNQSALNQYLAGKIPLNIDAAIKFAELLGCAVSDFSPSVVEQVQKYSVAVGATSTGAPVRLVEPSRAPPLIEEGLKAIAELSAIFLRISPEEREDVLNLARDFDEKNTVLYSRASNADDEP